MSGGSRLMSCNIKGNAWRDTERGCAHELSSPPTRVYKPPLHMVTFTLRILP
jgi:hypothetical protein